MSKWHLFIMCKHVWHPDTKGTDVSLLWLNNRNQMSSRPARIIYLCFPSKEKCGFCHLSVTNWTIKRRQPIITPEARFPVVSRHVIISKWQFPSGFGAVSLGPHAPGRSGSSCQDGLQGRLVPVSAHMKTFLRWFIFRHNLKQISTSAESERGCARSVEARASLKRILFCVLLVLNSVAAAVGSSTWKVVVWGTSE